MRDVPRLSNVNSRLAEIPLKVSSFGRAVPLLMFELWYNMKRIALYVICLNCNKIDVLMPNLKI